MSRLIDADELMEEIRSFRMTVTGLRAGKGVLNECMRHFSEGILKIIDEQPTVNDWIPCSERLPEEDYDTVLAVTKKNHYSVYVYTKEYGFRTGDIDAEGDVIAWMPLPEPYRQNKCHGCFGAANNDCERCAR